MRASGYGNSVFSPICKLLLLQHLENGDVQRMCKYHNPMVTLGQGHDVRSITREASAAPTASLCAGHAQQLGGESALADLMEVRPSDDARATAARRGLKEAWNKRASR
jgi:hypothetical protein